MKSHFLFIYLIILAWGGVYIVTYRGDPPAETGEAGTVAENRLAQPDDLLLYTNGRRFVIRQTDKGKLVGLGEVLSAPEFVGEPGVIPISLSVGRDLINSGAIGVGKALRICPLDVPGTARVVVCRGGDGECLTFVDIAAGDADKLKAAEVSELSLNNDCG